MSLSSQLKLKEVAEMKLYRVESSFEPPEDMRAVCYVCSCCGNEIREGAEYWDLRFMGYGVLCKSCVEDVHHYDAEPEY